MADESYDVVVIGGGPGGYVAAIRAAQLGFKTACVDKRKAFGGTCLNVGCIPSKALLQSSEHYAFMKNHAKDHGLKCDSLEIDFPHMMDRKDQVVDSLTKGIAGLFQRNKVTPYHGLATFVSPNEIEVNGENGESQRLQAKHFIVATGSESIELPFLPFDEKRVVSSTGALSLPKIPKTMIVIGAGVIGVELASVYNRLGSQVTVIEMLDHICPGLDKGIGKQFQKILTKQGLTFHLSSKVSEAKISDADVSLSVETPNGAETFQAEVVLVGIGRRPFSEGLGLDGVGVTMTKRGFVEVDGNFRTKVPNIYAIGDLIEGPMLAHRASEEGIAVAEVIAGMKTSINYMTIPNVIYTQPEVAGVGLTEEEAKDFGMQLKVGTCAFIGNPRARCAGETDGLVKVIGEASTGKLLGIHILGPHASEMIGEGVLAMERRATLDQLAYASHAHPTLSEAIKEAALNALGRAIHL